MHVESSLITSIHSWMLSRLCSVKVAEDDFYIKSDAILRIGKQLNVPFWLLSTLALPLPHFVRDTVYDQVSMRGETEGALFEQCCLQRCSPW